MRERKPKIEKKQEEDRKRATDMHQEQMKVLQGLPSILERIADSKK